MSSMMVKYPLDVDGNSPFPIENIPFGIFSTRKHPIPRIGTIIGEYVLDISLIASRGLFPSENYPGISPEALRSIFSGPSLNAFASQGPEFCSSTRSKIVDLLSDPNSNLFTNDEICQDSFLLANDAIMHLPLEIGGFTDFLCSDVHAKNCARLAGQSLHPSFYGFPTAYNGRASSVVISKTPVQRPRGMILGPLKEGTGYEFKPTARFDFELEIGVFVSKAVPYGQTITADVAAKEHIFGFVLLNDWSARDVQFAEMIPLGPFNGKATATTISPWVIMPEALGFSECGTSVSKAREEASLLPPHLQHQDRPLDATTFDLDLEVSVVGTDAAAPAILCKSNLRHLYWSPAQMLAHQASSGCGLRTGDLIGTGTISGPGHTDAVPTLGCLFELTEAGKKAVSLPSGRQLTWLEDGDEVVFRGWGRGKGGKKIGFGEAQGLVVPTE